MIAIPIHFLCHNCWATIDGSRDHTLNDNNFR